MTAERERTSRRRDRRLAAYLREDLVPFSPYYARLFAERGLSLEGFRGVRDLARLPFTTKEEILAATDADPLALVLRPTPEAIRAHWPPARSLPLLARRLLGGEAAARRALEREFLPVFMTATTGRAARPVSFLYAGADIRRLAEAGGRAASVIGLTTADRCVNLFPFAPHLAFWQVAFAGFEAGVFTLSTGGGKTIGTGGNLRALDRVRPTVLLGVPSYVYHLLRVAEAEGIRLPDLRRVVLGAERVPDGLRERLAAMAVRLGARRPPAIIGTYGFTEAKMAWAECAEGTGYHLDFDMGVIEVVDPETGVPVEEGGDGEIVFTSLGARGTAVLRYRTGDFVEGGVRIGACPACGRFLPRLSAKITRLSNRKDVRLTKVKGTLVDLNHIAAVLAGIGEIEEWQFEISKKDDDPGEVDVLTLYCAALNGRPLDRDRIARAVFEATEVAPNRIEVLPLPEMIARLGLETELKERRFVDRRPS